MKLPLPTLLTFILTATAPLCDAFPPAPPVTVHGNVRDNYGFLVDGVEASIVFKSGERVLQRAPLETVVTFGENYRTQLALDMKVANGIYKPGVVDTGLPFTVLVEIGEQTFYPMEATVDLGAPDVPGSIIRLDFTLGEDSDGDGLPDEWELWQLQAGGMRPGDEGYGLEHVDPDGDNDGDGMSNRDEYLAGTFAYMGADKLDLKIVQHHPDGWLELELPAVIDKTYRFLSSTDGQLWLPVSAGLDGERTALDSSFRATSTRPVRFIIPPAEGQTDRLFRVSVN